uniref:ATP synthase subunit a n=1 Tax=Nembrotha kubaryana TaxID=351409 RepID=A0A1W5YJP6_NEMKU|nr:ATP synthase F0 subunit 6 [Nembrotha kubaryana]ARI43827.1 ATP synthase F0 subunit 6 [Nembrotha kubaryana]
MWLTPILMACLFSVSGSWGQSYNKTILTFISVNGEGRQKSLLGLPLMLFSLMLFLLSMNFLGLVPFMYGPTSNIWVSAGLALVFWSSLIISGWVSFPVESAAHIVPSGAPTALVPFLILVETGSIFIRPLTLTIRIIANISTGHIIMGLIANVLVSSSLLATGFAFVVHLAYNTFEVFVCTVQAYVFTLLVKLYAEEHPSE